MQPAAKAEASPPAAGSAPVKRRDTRSPTTNVAASRRAAVQKAAALPDATVIATAISEPDPDGEPRAQPQADGEHRERAERTGRRQDQRRGRMQRRQLVAVGAQQRQCAPQQDEDRAADEDGTGA